MQDFQPYIPYLAYAGVALVALIILIFVLRAFSGRSRGRKGMRLGIVEYCEVDQTRRLVLLRRDDVEHLVLIGGSQDIVVENNIGINPRDLNAQSPNQSNLDAGLADDIVPIRPPRAPVFGAARRPALRPVSNTPHDDDPNTA